MTRTTLRKLLLAVFAGLLFILHVPGSSLAQQAGRTTPEPIELSGITLEYAVVNEAGELVWGAPSSDKPNVIPAESVRLRFTAKITNRLPGVRIRLRGIFHELCPSPDPGKKFLSKLKHLTETDPGGLTPDPADDEEQTIKSDGTVVVELVVHCEVCGEAKCGKKCGEYRDHLGEGPHVLGVTTSDAPPSGSSGTAGAARHEGAAAAKPSSYRVDLKSVCPAQRKPQPRGKNTTRRG